jgi:uncharacterized protein
MTAYYFDTSGLIKRYVTENGSDWVRQLFQSEQEHLFITCRLTMPEVYSALSRRLREGSVSLVDYRANIQSFHHDSGKRYNFIELTAVVIERSRLLLERYPLRANDAVQLASALIANHSLVNTRLDSLIFVSADKNLLATAKEVDLRYVNPIDYEM